jgi:hypothetical protein
MEILRQAARLLGRKNRQYETLTEVNVAGAKVRIWREAKSLHEASQFNHGGLSEQMLTICETVDPKHWQEELMKLPKVACVAIVNVKGNGVNAYPDWY